MQLREYLDIVSRRETANILIKRDGDVEQDDTDASSANVVDVNGAELEIHPKNNKSDKKFEISKVL